MVAGAGVLAGIGTVWLASHQPSGRPTEPGPVLTLLVGVSLVGSGLASWRARPENRLGQIMVFTGFAWFSAQLVEASAPWLYTIGLTVQSVFIVGLAYLLLSFPSGRLARRLDRGLVAAGAALTVGLQLLAMLYGNKAGLGCPSCTDNLVRVFANNALGKRFVEPPAPVGRSDRTDHDRAAGHTLAAGKQGAAPGGGAGAGSGVRHAGRPDVGHHRGPGRQPPTARCPPTCSSTRSPPCRWRCCSCSCNAGWPAAWWRAWWSSWAGQAPRPT